MQFQGSTGVAQHSQHSPGGGGVQQTQAGQKMGSSVWRRPARYRD